jgi:hypothetical protein
MNLSGLKTNSLRSAVLVLLTGASLTALALGGPSHALDPQPLPLPAPVSNPASSPPGNLADIVERVSPSVVQIVVRQGSPLQRVSAPEEEFRRGIAARASRVLRPELPVLLWKPSKLSARNARSYWSGLRFLH